MTASSDHLELAAEFPVATAEDWSRLATAVLRKSGVVAADATDVDPRALLTHPDDSGLPVAPIYGADDLDPALLASLGVPGQAPFVRGATAEADLDTGWDVRARHADPSVEVTNAAVLADLERGATSLWLQIGPGAVAVEDLARVLAGVYLDLAPVVLDAGPHAVAAADALLALAPDPSVLRGNLGADPIGAAVRGGPAPDLTDAVTLAQRSLAQHPGLRAVTVDGSAIHDAGGTDVLQLAYATSAGVAYLRALTDAGLSPAQALDQLDFRWSVTDEQFGSIALLRAARRVWARVAELSGAPEHGGQRQHAVTSAAMMTRRDPWVNLLRTTVACVAAAVGGAGAITVAPYDAAIGLPVELARRLARNTQAILHDESSLGRVVDPAGGSWFVESATDALARAAWDAFTALERDGGILAALSSGRLADELAAARAARADRIAHRTSPVTGVSEFPDLAEPAVSRPDAAPGGYRYAAAFEALRDRSDAVLAATGARPTVVLAAIGPLSAYSARTQFAANLFAAGGIATEVRTDVGDVTGAVVCLCSSDRLYAESAAETVAQLRGSGAARVLLAGRPREDAAVDGFLFAGCDALRVLTEVWEVIA